MTGIDVPADAPATAPRRPRVRMPASRGGVAWVAVVVIIGLFVAVQFGRQIYTNWEVGQRANEIRAQIAALEGANTDLRRELQYLQSDAYISAEARRLANIGIPGEQVLIIPFGAEEPLPEVLAVGPPAEPLLGQWVELFFGAAD